MENAKKGLIILLLLIFILGGVYLGTKNSHKEGPTNYEENEAGETKSYVGNYGFKKLVFEQSEDESEMIPVDEDENGEQDFYFDTLHLRSDGTFILSLDNYYASMPSVGVYTINDDNTITLEEKVIYGSDACFYKENLHTYTAIIKDDSTLSVTFAKETIDFAKDAVGAEDEDSLLYYVTDPKDNVAPSEKSETWIDCTNMKRK